MKLKYILMTVILSVCATSCHDLSLEPKGILGEAELFGNEFGVKKYFTGLYMYLPIEDFNYYARTGSNTETGYRANNYWEAGKFSLGNMSGEFVNTWIKVNNDGFGYWCYNRIRDVNLFINNFPLYKDDYVEATYNSLLGEAYFLRAFFYYGMAKRYGGIPIITEVQDPLDAPEVLQVPRAKEYDTWKFIHDDLQFAIDNMSETSDLGRANKYVAAALMSRTMLYAGTIAKYTHYLGFEADQEAAQKGFAGIDASYANEFFQYSYDAGKIIENSGRYSLYTKDYPDKALNFANLFLDYSSPENIFVKDFDKNAPNDTRLRHCYDMMMSPQPDMVRDVGAQSYPSLDLMRLYDFPAITDAEGRPIRFDKREDIRNEMEPRMRGCMYFDGDELRGHTFSIQRGLYKTFPWQASAAGSGDNTAAANINDNRILGYQRGDTYDYNGTTVRVNGDHGLFESWGGENNPITGAFIRKYIDTNLPVSEAGFYMSGQHWIVFRLGEIYLNQAEACYELGKKAEAFDYIEKIRERAGCKVTRPADDMTDLSATYGYPIDANLQFIRDERYRELAFEAHRWWDIRRWRVADRVLSNWIPRVLMCYYVLDEGKYIYLDEHERWNQNWNANKNCYYEGIPGDEINKNPNLLPRNPLR
jgi:hypothetical protein